MKNVQIRSTVTKPDGFYFMEAYEMRNLSPEASAVLESQFEEFKKLAAKANTGGQYTGILSVIADSVPLPDVVSHMTKEDFGKIQQTTHEWGNKLLSRAHGKK